MSIKLMTQVWEKQFTHSEQAIMLAMADYADDDGRNCYPSYDRLAWKTGYSERQVQRIIKGLCERGVLVVIKPATQHQSTHYWLRLDKAKDKPPFRVDNYDTDDDVRVDMVSTLNTSRVDKCNIQGRQMRHPRVDTMSTNPSVEPSIEPPIVAELVAAPPPPKSKTPQQAMFEVVCEAIGWDHHVITERNRAQVAQAVKVLRDNGYGVDDVKHFMLEVWRKDWRWEKKQSLPTLAQLREEIGKIRSVVQGAMPKAATGMDGYRQMLAEHGITA